MASAITMVAQKRPRSPLLIGTGHQVEDGQAAGVRVPRLDPTVRLPRPAHAGACDAACGERLVRGNRGENVAQSGDSAHRVDPKLPTCGRQSLSLSLAGSVALIQPAA